MRHQVLAMEAELISRGVTIESHSEKGLIFSLKKCAEREDLPLTRDRNRENVEKDSGDNYII